MIYDHELDADGRSGRPVADWGGDELFESMPRRRAVSSGHARRFSSPATGSHAARRGGDASHATIADAAAGMPPTAEHHVTRDPAGGRFPSDGTAADGRLTRDPATSDGRFTRDRATSDGRFTRDDATSDGRFTRGDATSNGRFTRDGATSEGRFPRDGAASDGRFTRDGRPGFDPFADDHRSAPDPSAVSGAEPVRAAVPAALPEPLPAPSAAPDAPKGRRTVRITGRPGASAVPARRRPQPTLDDRVGSRPDRIAGWAFGLGITLILIAMGTSDAGII